MVGNILPKLAKKGETQRKDKNCQKGEKLSETVGNIGETPREGGSPFSRIPSLHP